MSEPTARQLECLERVTRPGGSVAQAAYEMQLAEQTVKNHLSALYRALGVRSQAQAVRVLGRRLRRPAA